MALGRLGLGSVGPPLIGAFWIRSLKKLLSAMSLTLGSRVVMSPVFVSVMSIVLLPSGGLP